MAGSFDRSALLESFLREMQMYIPEIENNLSRLQRQPSNSNEVLEEIYRRAHTIAGSAAMMDIMPVSQVARALEDMIGSVLDGEIAMSDPVRALALRTLTRLRQLIDLTRSGAGDNGIVAQNQADYAALRGNQAISHSIPRAMGGPGMTPPSYGAAPASQPFKPAPQPPSQPFYPPAGRSGPVNAPTPSQPYPLPGVPSRAPAPTSPQQMAPSGEYLPTLPLQDATPAQLAVTQTHARPMAETSVWQDVTEDMAALTQVAGTVLKSIGALRDLHHRFDGERNELTSFMDGSRDALERLEDWAGRAMGIDLRTSPEHVRRYLPLSVLWVVTTRMKALIDELQNATRGFVTYHESLDDVVRHLRTAIDQAGQIVSGTVSAASQTADGGFSATVAQFSWSPPRATDNLSPGNRAELERQAREELRRELEDEVRTEIATRVRHEEERALRRELEIEVRRQVLSEISPPLAGAGPFSQQGMPSLATPAMRPAPVQPRRYEMADNRTNETIEIFRGEAEEHLQTLASGLGTLETNPHDKEAIRSIRRAVHTLKGAAGITGFNVVADLAHLSEDLLDRLADDTLILNAEALSLLLDTSQALEAMIQGDTAEQGGDAGLLAALRPRYQSLLGEISEGINSSSQPIPMPTPTNTLRAPTLVTEAVVHATEDPDSDLTAGEEARTAAERNEGISDLNVRLSLRKLDDLITMFGDILVNRSVVEERMARLTRMISETATVTDRLREVGGTIERQYEAQFLPSQRQQSTSQFGHLPPTFGGVVSGPNAIPDDFDPIEKDRYTEFHRLSRGLNESITDASTLTHEIETLVREMDVAIARERRLSSLFQDSLLKARLVPISSLVPRLYRAMRAVALKYNKEFEFLVEGEDTELDRSVYEDIAAPLLHMVRNAIYHGIEPASSREAKGKSPTGQITLNAHYEGNQLVISVHDDGNGINAENVRATAVARGMIDSYTQLDSRELINLIFQPGFSTSESVTEEAGRGIGLDVVRDMAARLRGTVEVDSAPGEGSTFILRIPISMQLQRVVLVKANDQTYAIPMTVVEQLVQFDFHSHIMSENNPAIEANGGTYPLAHLATFLGMNPSSVMEKTPVLLLNSGTRRWGLLVDAVLGQHEIVAKNLGPHLRNVQSVLGATVLGNGQVVLILDPIDLLQRPLRQGAVQPVFPTAGSGTLNARSNTASNILSPLANRNPVGSIVPSRNAAPTSIPYILVVDDSPSVRRVVSTTLKNAGWDVMTARDGQEALEVVAKRMPVGILLDIEMPRMDGYELMAALRNQPAFHDVPMIVLTSRAASKHQQKALQLGASAYVVKPYQDEQLLSTVRELVSVQPNGQPK
jgi:chemotaxis protein histidine kinase CheA/ActR/RegA family two-component response regulator